MARLLLIHGAWHGAWCWSETIRALERLGHPADAIDLPGQGDDHTPLGDVTLCTMADRIVAAVRTSSAPVTLVGHSLGGMAIAAAAEMEPGRIERLVFVCAFLPRDGESLLALEQRNPNPAVPASIVPADDHVSGTIRPDSIRDLFYHDCPADAVAEALARLRPQALAPLSTAVRLTADRFGRIPRRYIACSQDRALPIAFQHDMIRRSAPIEVRTLPAGHSPFLSMPAALAAALVAPTDTEQTS